MFFVGYPLLLSYPQTIVQDHCRDYPVASSTFTVSFANCCLYLTVMRCLWRRFLLYPPIARAVSRSVTILRPIPNGTFLLVSRTLRAPTRSAAPASTIRFIRLYHTFPLPVSQNEWRLPVWKNILFEHNSCIVHPSATYAYKASIIFASTLSTVVFVFCRLLTSIRVGKKQRLFARSR